jgi:RNA polymerase sigma-70 factor (ECF subfamily)
MPLGFRVDGIPRIQPANRAHSLRDAWATTCGWRKAVCQPVGLASSSSGDFFAKSLKFTDHVYFQCGLFIVSNESAGMNDPETDRLLSQAAVGDRQAVEQLLMRHHDRLRQSIVMYLDPRLSTRIDASDVLQDAMARAVERLPQYLAERSMEFYPWIRQLVRDQLIDAHRRHVQAHRRTVRREARWPTPDLTSASAVQLVDYLAGSAATPSAVVGRQEQKEIVRLALEQLAPIDQEILLMRFGEQLRVQEIAQVLSITVAAAKSRLRRSLEKMYQLVHLNQSDRHGD